MRFSTILILFLAFSQISLNICGTLMRSKSSKRAKRSRSRSKSKTAAPAQNKYYQLFLGLLFGLSGLEDKDLTTINSCLPDPWKSADNVAVAGLITYGSPKAFGTPTILIIVSTLTFPDLTESVQTSGSPVVEIKPFVDVKTAPLLHEANHENIG